MKSKVFPNTFFREFDSVTYRKAKCRNRPRAYAHISKLVNNPVGVIQMYGTRTYCASDAVAVSDLWGKDTVTRVTLICATRLPTSRITLTWRPCLNCRMHGTKQNKHSSPPMRSSRVIASLKSLEHTKINIYSRTPIIYRMNIQMASTNSISIRRLKRRSYRTGWRHFTDLL
jgi:hypothetical protein